MDEKGRIQHNFEPEIERSISTATPHNNHHHLPWETPALQTTGEPTHLLRAPTDSLMEKTTEF